MMIGSKHTSIYALLKGSLAKEAFHNNYKIVINPYLFILICSLYL